tara:strand:- start:357 stop:1154 length:798 start_codon:yes stop_codon:yes gene_type:complete
MKKGRFSKTEQVFIRENYQEMSVSQIATQLDRDPDSVDAYIEKKLGKTKTAQKEIEASYELKNRPYWNEIIQQFNEDELEIIQYHWGRIISQFRDDVLPTEELQVLDAIKLEVLMNRALKTQQLNMTSIQSYELKVTVEKEQSPELQDKDYIFNLERQIAVLRSAQETLGRDYKDLQTKKAAMLKDLKATREQRIKRLEDSKQTFIGWVRNLMSNPQTRAELGTEMEKMRLAVNKEEERLTEYHKYEDSLVDQPFLTPDTTKGGE